MRRVKDVAQWAVQRIAWQRDQQDAIWSCARRRAMFFWSVHCSPRRALSLAFTRAAIATQSIARLRFELCMSGNSLTEVTICEVSLAYIKWTRMHSASTGLTEFYESFNRFVPCVRWRVLFWYSHLILQVSHIWTCHSLSHRSSSILVLVIDHVRYCIRFACYFVLASLHFNKFTFLIQLRRGLFDCAQIWYRVWPWHSRHITNVQGQRSKAKVTGLEFKVTA